MNLKTLALILLCTTVATESALAQERNREVLRARRPIAGRYVVVLADNDDPEAVGREAEALYRGRLHRVYRHTLHGFAIRLTPEAAAALARDPRVAYVEEDGVVQISDTELSPPSWGLDRIDQHTLPLDSSYTYGPSGTVVHVHVIDTGIRVTHTEFGGRAFIAGDFVDDDNNPATDPANDDGTPGTPDGADCNGHGTHVAGTIGGLLYGVAKHAILHAYRALDCSGIGTGSGVIAAIDAVAADSRRPAVANMSLGGGLSPALDDAVRRAITSGVTFVVSAGNGAADASAFSPSGVAEAITVGATDINDSKPVFSNYGPALDVFAPGVNIASAWYTSDTALAGLSGTSMSAPHVAGVAALYMEKVGNKTPQEVRDAIVAAATSGVVVDPGAGSPNLLLYSGFTLTAPAPEVNVALASNGAVASASSVYGPGHAASGAINGDRKGLNWGSGGGWNDGTLGTFPDWLEVDFNAAYPIDRINVFSVQDAYWAPVEPYFPLAAPAYGLTAFDVQYWNGSAWVTVPGGAISGNTLVWRTVTFTPITTQRIRVLVYSAADAWSRMTEVEAFTTGEAVPPPPPPPPPPPETSVNVASAANGATALASSVYSAGYAEAGAINGDRRGLNWGAGGGWNDATSSAYPDWLEIDFNNSYSIDRINVFSVQDAYLAPIDPTATTTFSLYGLKAFDVQYWTGIAWATVPGGTIAGNTLVWRTVTFTPITTQKIRVVVNGAVDSWSRITEVEAFTASGAPPPPPPPPPPTVNVALASNGATALASSVHSAGYAAGGAINGDRQGQNWGAGGGWNDGTPGAFPDWLEVDFNAAYSIDHINVFSVQDAYLTPIEPAAGMTFTAYGLTAFDVQYWDGTAWVTAPGGAIAGNTLVWRTVTFTPITTQKIRLVVNNALNTWSRITEVEAFTAP